jgi:hypothetical protein
MSALSTEVLGGGSPAGWSSTFLAETMGSLALSQGVVSAHRVEVMGSPGSYVEPGIRNPSRSGILRIRHASSWKTPLPVGVLPPAVPPYAAAVLADAPAAYYRLGDPGPTVTPIVGYTASSNFAGEIPLYAFDSFPNNYWTTASGATGWVSVQYVSAKTVTKYSVARRDDSPTRNPKDWTLEGSNNGSTWTVIDTRTNITWPTAGELKRFTVNGTPGAYTYYRLNVTANNGDSFLSVATISLNDETLMIDSSGNNRHGFYYKVTMGAAGGLTGDTDTAATFNGADAFAHVVPYAAWMDPANFTLEARLKTTQSGIRSIWDRDEQSLRSWQFRMNGGALEFIKIAGGIVTITHPSTLANGAWHHVAATYDGTNLKFYIDGTLVKTTAMTSPAGQATAIRIGANWSGGNASALWTDQLDEMAYYPTALSQARITAHVAAL